MSLKIHCLSCKDTGWMQIQDTRDPDPATVPCDYCAKGAMVKIRQRKAAAKEG